MIHRTVGNAPDRRVLVNRDILRHRLRHARDHGGGLNLDGARCVEALDVEIRAGDGLHFRGLDPAVGRSQKVEVSAVGPDKGLATLRRRTVNLAFLAPVAVDAVPCDDVTEIVLARPIEGDLLPFCVQGTCEVPGPDVVGLVDGEA